MRERGVSLLELLIALALAALMTTMLTTVITLALGWSRQGETSTFQFTEASLALERMTRELGPGSLSLLQDPETLREGTASVTVRSSSPLSRQEGEREDDQVIRYAYDQSRQRLLRTLYEPDFDPDNPLTQREKQAPGNPAILATSLRAVSFSIGEDHLLRITLTLATGAPLRTKVAAPSLARQLEW